MARGETDEAHFALDLLHKDLTYALDFAGGVGAALPVAALARELFGLARARGLGAKDYSAVVQVFRRP